MTDRSMILHKITNATWNALRSLNGSGICYTAFERLVSDLCYENVTVDFSSLPVPSQWQLRYRLWDTFSDLGLDTLPWSGMTEHQQNTAVVMLMVYTACGFAFLFYFLGEICICHYSRRTESLFLSFVVVLIMISSSVCMETVFPLHNRSLAARMRTVACCAVCMTLLIQFRPTGHIKPFFVGSPAREKVMKQVTEPTPRAWRVSREIKGAINEMTNKELPVLERCLTICILVLYMLEDVAAAFRLPVFWFPSTRIVYGLVAVVVLVCIMTMRRHWRWRRFLAEYIDDMVKHSDSVTLQYVLATTSVGSIIEGAPDKLSTLVGGALNKRLLDVVSKAILIDALQTMHVRFHFNAGMLDAVEQLITSCTGDDLVLLKTLIDGSADDQNLYRLVWYHIPRGPTRDRILRHIVTESRKMRKSLHRAVGLKILSDVDDTFVCSGAAFPAGCDKTYPQGVIYPGCKSLYELLDKESEMGKPTCNLVFLSARPHLYKGVSELYSFEQFAHFMQSGQLHCMPTLLPGELLRGIWAILTTPFQRNHAWRHVGNFKYDAYARYSRLYEEYDHVFLGDDGQGDLLAGQMMLLAEHQNIAPDAEFSDGSSSVDEISFDDGRCCECLQDHLLDEQSRLQLLKAVLIHRVLPAKDQPLQLENWDKAPAACQKRLLLHNGCVGAAWQLHNLYPEILSFEDVVKVAHDALDEFDRVRLMFPGYYDEKYWSTAERDLRDDLAQVSTAMRAAGHAPVRNLSSFESLLRHAEYISTDDESEEGSLELQ
eukprot:TRINITY_DN57211_c0_g1_i1.p1 TRINITY_DN57211_c0_g1~~TRINITY_DN57211_c0_g1_i1.p1  ORF type:complete len:828 (-),score=130.31 TRINITY_DN57211_c0_g1_i1:417-2726(-)